jgi:hypothetical protein
VTVQPINIDSIAPGITAPPNQTVQQVSTAGVTVTYPAPTIVETGSGIASSNCLPASGSVFAVGVTTVTCTATDQADNTGSAAFSVTVNPVAPTADGRMYGVGFLEQDGKHQHFVFGVAQVHNRSTGRFEYWVNDPRRCGSDDDFDRDPTFNGDHDGDFGRDHHAPPNHFEAMSVTSVVFSDDPAFQPGLGPRPTIDTVRFSGAGKWNGRAGYTFEAVATDQGEPGRRRDTFSLIVRDGAGNVVVNVNGSLGGGNIQSTRLGPRQ